MCDIPKGRMNGRKTDRSATMAVVLALAVQDIGGVPTTSAPESIVVYPNTRDVQILFDQGDHDVGDDPCKDADTSAKYFGDVIIHVP